MTIAKEKALQEIKELEKAINKKIVLGKFIRQRIVAEEIVLAYISPVPSAVVDKHGKAHQVNKGNWVAIHQDGTKTTYTIEEFEKIFEVLEESDKPTTTGNPGPPEEN